VSSALRRHQIPLEGSTMEEKQYSVLVIDDEESMRDSCCLILAKEGFETDSAENGESGLAKLQETQPDFVLIDLKMPGIGGLEVLDQVKKINRDIIPIVITGYATVGSAVEAMKRGAYDFLPKPFTPEELRLIVRRGIERKRLQQEAESLRREKTLIEENFITMVSHQLRSPLVAVAQYFEVILGGHVGGISSRQRDMIEKANVKLLWSPIVALFAISPSARIIMQMAREDEPLSMLNVCEVADHSGWPKVVKKKRG